jgi:hypothetical protein
MKKQKVMVLFLGLISLILSLNFILASDITIEKTISKSQINLGENFNVDIVIRNNLNSQETIYLIEDRPEIFNFIGYEPFVQPYANLNGTTYVLPYIYMEKTLPALGVLRHNFTISIDYPGNFLIRPTIINTADNSFFSNSLNVKVLCNKNKICEINENYINCPEDCTMPSYLLTNYPEHCINRIKDEDYLELDVDCGPTCDWDCSDGPFNPSLIKITNCQELQNIKNNLTASYKLVKDIDCSETKIWNNGQGFEPIGMNPRCVASLGFKGNFDGNNFSIINLTIRRGGNACVGLFGTTYNANISNLVIINSNVTGFGYVGNLVGRNVGNIKNVHINGESYRTSATSGPTGVVIGDNNYGKITDSGFYSTQEKCCGTGDCLGCKKIPSLNERGTYEYPLRIRNCNDLQNINNSLSSYYVLENNINCSETKNWNIINGTAKGFFPIKGFSGVLDGQGYNITNLFINRLTDNYVGLFGTVNNSRLSGIKLINPDIRGKDYLGSLVGYVYSGVIEKSAVIGGRIYKGRYFGSLIGINKGIINNSYSSEITMYCDSGYCGGLIGYNYGVVQNSYSAAKMNINNPYYVGGLISRNYGIVASSFAVSDPYYYGTGNNYIGGLISANNGGLGSAYFYSSSSTKKCCYTGDCTNCTLMTNKNIFYNRTHYIYSGWDFNNIWKETSRYPILR